MALNATHDPELRSWVEGADDPAGDFPIQNLPFGIFRRRKSREQPRGGVAIGDQIFDLAALGGDTGPTLNKLAAAGPQAWRELRKVLSLALSDGARAKRFAKHLLPMRKAELFVPVAIGDYSDFYAGIHHATTIGKLFRPDNPLLPNYKWLPIGYHGRASSVVISGTPVLRPKGQVKSGDTPQFVPTRRLDYEVELGFIVGPGNALGKPIPIRKAEDHIFGVVLLNDWSARDIQAWEYQPLGPFLAKSFATTISPWVVTLEALAPFRCPPFARGAGDPPPLEYLHDPKDQGLSIGLEMQLRTAQMRKRKLSPHRLSRGNACDAYWTAAQMVAHHASNGCNLRPGDLLGSGTLSGPSADALGSLMELTQAGKAPLSLPGGETRTFLEEGDEVIQRGRCESAQAVAIGFGEAAGVIR
jgi:fumarylacetoacetase